MCDGATGIERNRLVETGQGRLRLAELFEREATIGMCPGIAWLDRNCPLEILNRLLQVLRLACEDAHGVQRIKMAGLRVQYFLVNQASGGWLALLLQGLCPGKLLRDSFSARVRHGRGSYHRERSAEHAAHPRASSAVNGMRCANPLRPCWRYERSLGCQNRQSVRALAAACIRSINSKENERTNALGYPWPVNPSRTRAVKRALL